VITLLIKLVQILVTNMLHGVLVVIEILVVTEMVWLERLNENPHQGTLVVRILKKMITNLKAVLVPRLKKLILVSKVLEKLNEKLFVFLIPQLVEQ